MLDYFEKNKKNIGRYLFAYLSSQKKSLKKINIWGQDGLNRLADFCTKGKMIRGGLVYLGYSLGSKKPTADVLACAAVMELLQSALLIHDDIMDHDYLRRGQPTIFAQYEAMAQKEKLNDYKNLGSALGICLGDIAFFLAYELLAKLQCSAETREKIINLISKEMQYVGLAQMQDIYFSQTKKTIKEKEVLKLYLYKTGRYTFSLPLMVGAILAGTEKQTIKILEKIGENLGIVFQVKDDELNLFGDPKITGKPAGSDLQESKKTLYYLNLKNLKNIKNQTITAIQKQIIATGIQAKINRQNQKISLKIKKLINKLPQKPEIKKILNSLIAYNLTRNK